MNGDDDNNGAISEDEDEQPAKGRGRGRGRGKQGEYIVSQVKVLRDRGVLSECFTCMGIPAVMLYR